MSVNAVPRVAPTRVLVCLGLLCALVLTGLAVPTHARADEVSAAQERVDKLQDLVKQTTDRLVVGTREWEADRARLRRVNLDLRNTERRIQSAQRVVDAGEARVAAVARRLYMNPAPDALQMAFTQGPAEILESLQMRGALNQVAGSDGQIVLRARTAKLRLRTQEAAARQLAAEASRLEQRSAARLRDLEELAQSTADRLDAAEQALQGARAAKERREAALARSRAAKAAAARAARFRFAGGPACTGKSTSGQSNGNLDPASLCPLWMEPGERLVTRAANAFNQMSKFHAASRGAPLCVTDSYRSYSEQVSVYRRKPGLAAVPGTSEHGWGMAVDLCGGVQNFGTAAHEWMRANAPRFGWVHPEWARQSGSKPEAWHWEFNG